MDNLGKSIKEIFDARNKYIIPLYQRNYAWGKEQIEALIQDIYEAYEKDKNSNYYIGSLVVLRRHNGDYEVIDGQQRLTTLSLLTKILGITKTPVLYYESRPEVEEFFAEFYESADNTCKTMKPQTHYLREAVEYIKEAKVLVGGEEKPFKEFWNKIQDYLKDNVILVKTEIPEDTDVATYFEIMNNRGEQLQKHEILKARLMNALESKYHDEFNLIWTACSTMDRPIQQCFNAEDRRRYFGDEYNEFVFSELSGSSEEVTNGGGCTINDILKGGGNLPSNSNNNDSKDDDNKVNSIIDFPNFLMHIMKLYANGSDKVRLNEKYMLEDAGQLFPEGVTAEDANKFLQLLFKIRTLFDRYVVKIKPGESDDDFSWVMYRPQKYESVKYDLFTFDTPLQDKLIKAQSMLQVTYRQRIYKNWLQYILSYLNKQNCNLSEIDGEGILKKLHEYMEIQYKALDIDFKKMYSKGVNTPHFLLNFIDYLYWLKKDDYGIKDFDFRYWNSVEHHLARNYAKDKGIGDETVDCLGNLFLISKSANSRLSDRSVSEKIERFKDRNMGANRQIIYTTTINKGKWDEDEIIEHYNELESLLRNYRNTLGL